MALTDVAIRNIKATGKKQKITDGDGVFLYVSPKGEKFLRFRYSFGGKNPVQSNLFKSRSAQYREDTRVCCHNCGTFFLPSLIVAEGTPRNEVQFLCRSQTTNAIEKFFLNQGKKVLTQLQSNIVENNSRRVIKNDVLIKRLEPKPTLIANMIQYTPFEKIMNLIDGTNIEKGDYLFNG